MPDSLERLLHSDAGAMEYFSGLPTYVREAVKKHGEEIDSAKAMKLFAESFMEDDSFRGA